MSPHTLLRRQMARSAPDAEARGFRIRSRDVSRVEGLSDAVFGFAITLLVVSLEVPRTFADLIHSMQWFGAFGACFAMLIMIWHQHYTFFRRYALEDLTVVTLNAMLLFVVVVVVFGLIAAMYLHAYRKRVELGLNAFEAAVTRMSLTSHAIWIGIALLSIAVANIGGPRWVPIAGCLYGLLGPTQYLNGRIMGRRAEAARAADADIGLDTPNLSPTRAV